jgi:uncharacterized phage-associated protein
MSERLYVPSAVANEFLQRGIDMGSLLTPMQLQKLVYISHGWNLGVGEGQLFSESVQAWKYGPVIPSLFHEFKVFGKLPITKLSGLSDVEEVGEPGDDGSTVEKPFIDPWDTDRIKLIDWVWLKYGHLSGYQLSELTHEDGTPWSESVKEMKEAMGGVWVPGWPIRTELIRNYYAGLLKVAPSNGR